MLAIEGSVLRRFFILLTSLAMLAAVNQASAEYGDICPPQAPEVCVNHPTKFDFFGTVTDRLARPLSGVRVEDEWRDPSTGHGVGISAADGTYRFHEDGYLAGRYELRATAEWMAVGFRSTGNLLGQDSRVDFMLGYRVEGHFTPGHVTQPGDHVILTLRARIPDPTTICMRLERSSATGSSRHFASLQSTDTSGVTTWVHDDGIVPDDIPLNASVTFSWYAEDCETRTILGSGTDSYYVP